MGLFVDVVQNLFGVNLGFDFFRCEDLFDDSLFVYQISGAKNAHCATSVVDFLTPSTDRLEEGRFSISDQGEIKPLFVGKFLLKFYSILAHADDSIAGSSQFFFMGLQRTGFGRATRRIGLRISI